MDIIKKFYEMVRIKQTLAFLVKAYSNERENIPFILKTTLVNSSLSIILPPKSQMVNEFAKKVCSAFYRNDKRKNICDPVVNVIDFNNYSYLSNNNNNNKEQLNLQNMKRKRKYSTQSHLNTETENKKLASLTTDVSSATTESNINDTKISLLKEFNEAIENTKKEFSHVSNTIATRANLQLKKPYIDALKAIQEKFKNKFIKLNVDIGNSLDILDILQYEELQQNTF